MHADDSANNAGSSDQGQDLIIGQKLGFAAASLTLGVCSFISLLGVEKAILAIVFGALAMKNSRHVPRKRLGLARFGVVLGVLHIALIAVLFIVFREDVMRLFEVLERFETAG